MEEREQADFNDYVKKQWDAQKSINDCTDEQIKVIADQLEVFKSWMVAVTDFLNKNFNEDYKKGSENVQTDQKPD